MRKYVLSQRGLDELKRTVAKANRPAVITPQRRSPRMPGEGGETEEHRAFCAEAAPADLMIKCYLDDEHPGGTWVADHDYAEDDEATGTDSKVYKCIKPHVSSINDKPITGANYAAYWEAVATINVYCDVFGGGYLEEAYPRLSIGDPMPVYQFEDIWYSDFWFNGSIVCEYEEPP